MAFILKQAASYSWPVKFELASGAGKFEQFTFDVVFKRLPQSRVEHLVDGLRNDTLNNVALCNELLVGWNGVLDEGVEIPFSEEAKKQLLEVTGLAGAIGQAWFESLAGSKRKN